jgi:hypothetical protein
LIHALLLGLAKSGGLEAAEEDAWMKVKTKDMREKAAKARKEGKMEEN